MNYMHYTMIIHQLQKKLANFHDVLSDHYKKTAEGYGVKVGDLMKLIPNFGNKTNYVFHYKNLQFYLSLGMKLTKIHIKR